jgi:hypothetical protein
MVGYKPHVITCTDFFSVTAGAVISSNNRCIECRAFQNTKCPAFFSFFPMIPGGYQQVVPGKHPKKSATVIM